ncbi:MAG: type I restriction enzyme endonuclease domain-containing protein [Pirellulaceae bacterium]
MHRQRRTGKTAIDTAKAVAVLLEKYEICCAMLHRFNWSKWSSPNHAGAVTAQTAGGSGAP